MISHQHKVIFIHVSKCAGSSIETAFGIDTKLSHITDTNNLFGWNYNFKMYLQHATPQFIIENELITKEVWDNYYKFIIVRDPWSRFHSGYFWLQEKFNLKGSFSEFLNLEGDYKTKTEEYPLFFLEDHLRKQKDYFYLNGELINYDRVIKFEEISKGLDLVIEDLNLPKGFFEKKVNITKNKKTHYSKFYNEENKSLVSERYKEDIEFLDYKYKEQISSPNFLKKILSLFN